MNFIQKVAQPFRWLAFGGLCFYLAACGVLDDYMLGKDNTQKPADLKPIKSQLTVVNDWSVPIGKPAKTHTFLKLKPAVKGNMIYTASGRGLVQAIDRRSGKVAWAKQLSHGLISGPTVAQGYIAVGTNAATVMLLKQADGGEVWQAKVSGDALSKPVIAGNKVIVKTVDGNLYAYALASGEKLWMSDHGAPNLILKASSAPVILDQMALVGFSDGKLDAVDLKIGNLVWQRSIAYPMGASDVERLVDIDADPIVRGDTVYLASYQGFVGAFSLHDGQFLWSKPASTYHNLAIDDKTLYMTDSNDVVWAFDRQNGNVRWKQIALQARHLTEPTLVNGHLVIGDRTGFLHMLSTENGALIARTQLGSPVETGPTVAGNHVYVMTSNGQLNRLSVG